MREFTKSLLSFSLGMSLFGVKQLGNILSSSDSYQQTSQAEAAGNTVTHTPEEQFECGTQGSLPDWRPTAKGHGGSPVWCSHA